MKTRRTCLHKTYDYIYIYMHIHSPQLRLYFLYIFFQGLTLVNSYKSLWVCSCGDFNPSLSISKLSTGDSNFSANSLDVSETRMPQNARLANSCPLRNRHLAYHYFFWTYSRQHPSPKKKRSKTPPNCDEIRTMLSATWNCQDFKRFSTKVHTKIDYIYIHT